MKHDPALVRILCVVGARPNYMKVAPIYRQLQAWPACRPVLVHTGQHYDASMSDVFFRDLSLPVPDIWLGVGSGTHAEQTARVMLGFEPVLRETEPALVIVVGDVNSTMACTLVAVKLGVPVAHVEAGLRSYDRTMPEEINRIVTDAVCEILLTPSEDADANLALEGISAERIHRVGNVMVDSLLAALPRVEALDVAASLGLKRGGYGLLTLHRPSNVDDPARLTELTGMVERLGRRLPLIAPLHPRTTLRLKESGLLPRWERATGVHLFPPLGYLDFVAWMRGAAYVLTDSGGVQEETTILGVPCLTLRPNTERPITVTMGTNRVVGDRPSIVPDAVEEILKGHDLQGRIPPLWDGHAAERVVGILKKRFGV